MVEGDLVGAVAVLRRARAEQRLPEIDGLVGLVALQGGQHAAARRRLEAAVQAGSDQPLIYYWSARAELAAGRPGPARARLEQALAVGGDRPLLRIGHAILVGQQQPALAVDSLLVAAAATGDLLDPSLFPCPLEGAIDLLEPLFRGFPSRALLLRTQGHLLWRAGRVLAAERRFAELLALTGPDADALQMLARAQLALGAREEARTTLDKALRLAPGLPQALAARGELLLEEGKPARAIEDLQQAADAMPRDARLLLHLAEACAAAERPECARRFFGYALLRDPTLGAAHLGLGLLEQQAGQVDQARQHLSKAQALDPGLARAAQAAAQLEAAAGRSGEARRWQAEAVLAARFEREQRRRLETAAREAMRQRAALRELARAPRCESSACRRAVAGIAAAPRAFLEAHLAIKRGDRGRARALLQELLPRLRGLALLRGDPTLIATAARTASGRRYWLRGLAPLIPSSRFGP